MSEPVGGVIPQDELVRLRAEVRDAAGAQPQLDLPPGEDEPDDHVVSTVLPPFHLPSLPPLPIPHLPLPQLPLPHLPLPRLAYLTSPYLPSPHLLSLQVEHTYVCSNTFRVSMKGDMRSDARCYG